MTARALKLRVSVDDLIVKIESARAKALADYEKAQAKYEKALEPYRSAIIAAAQFDKDLALLRMTSDTVIAISTDDHFARYL